MSWDKAFDEPINLPDGKTARTLRQAGEFVATLPAREAENDRWKAGVEALLLAADGRRPVMHARIGVLRALRNDVAPAAASQRKDRPWGRRPLARDR